MFSYVDADTQAQAQVWLHHCDKIVESLCVIAAKFIIKLKFLLLAHSQ